MRSFEELLTENTSYIETYVKYKVSRQEDAKDILQEVYLQAFKSFKTLNREESFKPWLISIARNKVNDYYRKTFSDQEVSLEKVQQSFVSINRTFTLEDKVKESLVLLSKEEQQILHMHFWQQMTYKEIAKKLSIPLGTVKSRLYKAKKHFKTLYQKEEKSMNKMPQEIPAYKIEKIEKEPFETRWEELMGWFLIPRLGNKISWGLYDFPERTLTEEFEMECVGKAEIHGEEGVKVKSIQKEGEDTLERTFVAQLTDTHCRYLAESHLENGIEKLYTFLDGDAFINNWGFGEDNIGNEIHLKQKGKIHREGSEITVDADSEIMDVVGRYLVTINGKKYDTICLMDIGLYDENTISEQYIDKNGRTILWRRFNKKNWRWKFDDFEMALDKKLEKNECIIVNGQQCFHWYDCITDYVL